MMETTMNITKVVHDVASKMDIPLIEAYAVGIIQILAGLSFLVPNKMPKWAKGLLIFCFCSLGGFYLYIYLVNIPETIKATFIRLILGFTGATIFIMNIGLTIAAYYTRKAQKLAGLNRRKDD